MVAEQGDAGGVTGGRRGGESRGGETAVGNRGCGKSAAAVV
jgi:hypothetical protein